MRLGRYPIYLPNNIEWLPVLPDAWQHIRARFVLAVNPSSAKQRELHGLAEVSFVPMEAVGTYGGLSLDHSKLLDEIGSGYTEFEDGDVVVAKITPCFENGKGALADGLVNGVAFGTTELHVLRVGKRLDRRFLFYLTMAHTFRALGESEMYGAGGQKRVPPEFVKDFRVPLPPLNDQRGIVRFLDTQTAGIDTLMAKKRDLIDKLKERRSALIARTVTRGLPPTVAKVVGMAANPKMKDSGVEWLGDVPTHWTVKQLKWAIMFQRGHDLPSERREEGSVPLVTSAGVSATHNVAAAKGPGIVTGRYGTIGRFHLVNEDYWPLNTTLYSIDLYGNSPSFLCYMLEHLSPLVVLHSVKYAVPGVDRNDLHPTRVALPSVVEQHAIAAFLDRETLRLDKLAMKVEAAIALLTEYRQALITSAVTGKIDVRQWQDDKKAA